MEGRRVVIAAVSEQGQLYPHEHTHTRAQLPTPPATHTHTHTEAAFPLTSVHPCVSNWNMDGFPPGWNRIGLPFPGTLFLTGLASLPTDCPHGYSCCHKAPAASAKSTALQHCQVADSGWKLVWERTALINGYCACLSLKSKSSLQKFFKPFYLQITIFTTNSEMIMGLLCFYQIISDQCIGAFGPFCSTMQLIKWVQTVKELPVKCLPN